MHAAHCAQTRALLRNAGLASASTNKRTGAVLAGVYQASTPPNSIEPLRSQNLLSSNCTSSVTNNACVSVKQRKSTGAQRGHLYIRNEPCGYSTLRIYYTTFSLHTFLHGQTFTYQLLSYFVQIQHLKKSCQIFIICDKTRLFWNKYQHRRFFFFFSREHLVPQSEEDHIYCL